MNLKVGDICQIIEVEHSKLSIKHNLLPLLGSLVTVSIIRESGICSIIVRYGKRHYYCKEEELKLIRKGNDGQN